MRITGITAYTSNTLRSKNNVNFGQFADKNADDKMKKLLADAPQWNSGDLHKMVKNEPSIIIRTEKDGTLQGELDNAYMGVNANKIKNAKILYEDISDWELLKDLHIKDNAERLAQKIRHIQERINGTTPKSSSYNSGGEDYISEAEYEKRRIRDITANSAQ